MPSHECMIIANPEGKAWDFAVSINENLNKRNKKYHLNGLYIKRFSDDEIKAKFKENLRRTNCFFIHDSSLHPSEWLTQLLFANEAMRNSSANEINDVLPYMKFARQDRKDESRVSISSKAVAKTIEHYADRVLTIDAHFTQIQGFYDIPFDNLYSSKLLLEYLKANHKEMLENIVVMSPDPGGASRARAFASKLSIENIAIGWKYKPEGKISEYKITGNVADKNILIVDDIVDSGGTLIRASEEAKKQGANKVYAYCTHGVFSGDARERIGKALDLMIVSNSISQPQHPKIEVIPLNELFAEAVYRTNEGLSLSEMFE